MWMKKWVSANIYEEFLKAWKKKIGQISITVDIRETQITLGDVSMVHKVSI